MLLAGGTDLLPNMKRRQQVPRVVGLRCAGGRLHQRRAHDRHRHDTDGRSWADDRLRARVRVLQAARRSRHRICATWRRIGGNLCLDTRCTYYDQSQEWRQAINFCMKKDGDTCWVATSSPKCLAVSSTDTAPMLQALGAACGSASRAAANDRRRGSLRE
jgi:4-hydroxybenzoyl-CoA reductase subunit beta